ncbi:MAG: Uma2 family endonuclease [Pirellulaceae bacterium]|nr:Uma2 family endonuclease [Pirellulaceae bacterium]
MVKSVMGAVSLWPESDNALDGCFGIIPLVANLMPTSAPDRENSIVYPTSDHRGLDGDINRLLMMDLIETLTQFFQGQKVYVSGNLLVFYEQGNNSRFVSPDVFVAKGVEMRMRNHYLLWKEEVPPSVVMEITSRTTRAEDTKKKFRIYRDEIEVAEYFMFDPVGDYLKPRLQGYRLVGSDYVPIDPMNGALFSEQLGLWFYVRELQLRLHDPQAGRDLPMNSRQLEEPGAYLRQKRQDT